MSVCLSLCLSVYHFLYTFLLFTSPFSLSLPPSLPPPQDFKSVQGANVKWSSLHKLRKKYSSLEQKSDHLTASEQLLQDMDEIISHRTKCSHELPK